MRAYVYLCTCVRLLIQNRKSIVRFLVKIRIAVTRRFVFFLFTYKQQLHFVLKFFYITSMISLPTIKLFMFY